MDSWPQSNVDAPLYDARAFAQPGGESPDWGPFGEAQPPLPPAYEELQVGSPLPESEPAPYPGAARLLHWTTCVVLSAGFDQRHPLSNKVELRVRLGALARETGLKAGGLAWIRRLCGPRYHAPSDTLRLVSQKFFTREDNRRDCLRILNELVDEGVREGGGLEPSAPAAAAVLARQAREAAAQAGAAAQ